jgi:halocyanin-like protein
MKRRDFLRAAGGSTAAATAATAAQPAAAAEGGGGGGGGSVTPDWGGWLSGIDGSFQDARGQGEVTVQVGAQGNGGAYAFEPAGLWVDTGTTVKWEWTGEGGGHNVVADSGPASLDSSTYSSSGVHYEHTFEEGGITTYYCDPHLSLGMKGAVAVGGEVPTVAAGGGEKSLHELGVPIQAHWVGIGAILGIVGVINYTFYVLKYGESPNTGNTGGGED